MTDDYGADPAGGELADVARRGAREWERDMSVWETDAELLRLRQRRLVNVLWEAMQRGDEVSVTIGSLTFTGRVRAARNDFALLDTTELRVALHVSALSAVSMEPGSNGVTGERDYGSFRAYLGMLEVEGPECRFVGDRLDVHGVVTVVADDHVLLDAVGRSGSWALPIDSIGAVILRP